MIVTHNESNKDRGLKNRIHHDFGSITINIGRIGDIVAQRGRVAITVAEMALACHVEAIHELL